LWIDGKDVIDNDGVHGFVAERGGEDLQPGGLRRAGGGEDHRDRDCPSPGRGPWR
jgi:hypothetical protein